MSTLTQRTELTEVKAIRRPKIGPVFRGIITVADIYGSLKKSTIRYAPRYQRGFQLRYLADMTPSDYDQLLPLMHPKLQLSEARAQEMAVKYLRGELFTSHVTWNARRNDGEEEPAYDDHTGRLILNTDITVPDTGHRHLAYYFLGQWKDHPEEIPENVVVNEVPIPRAEIERLIDEFDPQTAQVFVDVYWLRPEDEGRLYDEFNDLLKAPARAVAIDVNRDRTPSRRLLQNLMTGSKIFSVLEIETRANTVNKKSRKLTTNATLEAAVRPKTKLLVELETRDRTGYTDLVEFLCAFFEEWAAIFPAFRAGARLEERQQARQDTFALSNIILFPLFELAFDFWTEYRANGPDWRTTDAWKRALRQLGGKSPSGPPIMSRDNPDWRGKILVLGRPREDGTETWVLSNNYQSRTAAYEYMRAVMGLASTTKTKPKK